MSNCHDFLFLTHLECEVKGGANIHLGLDIDVAPMGLYQVLDQVQAQASSSILAGGGHIHLCKRRKDISQCAHRRQIV